MAIDNVFYPEYIDSYAGFVGGIEWMPGTGMRNIRISTVKDLDLSGVDKNVNKSLATAKRIELFPLSTNLVVVGYFWYELLQEDIYAIEGFYKIYNKSTGHEIDNNTFMNQVTGGGVFVRSSPTGFYGNNFFTAPDFLLKTDKAKICLITEYSDIVATGVSMPQGFGFKIFYPCTNTVVVPAIQLWNNVRANYVGSSASDAAFQTTDPESFYYPFNGSSENILYINDMTAFNNWIHGTDTSYNVQDHITIGNSEEDQDKPIQDYDPSQPGGGGGNYDPNSDPIDFPALPTGGALSSGAIKAFAVDNTILNNLFNKLWDTSIFDVATWQKLLDNPMDCIISLHAIPVIPSTSGSGNIKLGNFDSGIGAPYISGQYVTIDCGSKTLSEFWGSALDYAPYTKCSIYLPFIGIKPLDIDDVMKAAVHVKYNIDILTGDCVANIKCGQSVLYKYTGNMKQDIPVSGRQSNLPLKAFQAAISMAGIAATGGASAAGGALHTGAILSGASTVAGTKTVTTRSGSMAGSIGLLDDFVPYIIIHRPIQSLANKFSGFKGYPSNISSQLGNLSGYTEVEYINLGNISATDAELSEIKNLLESGVLI